MAIRNLVFLVLSIATLANASPTPKEGFQWDGLGLVATQERGRIKPLDTFARESMQFLTGKLSWNGIKPVEFLFGLLFRYEDWENEKFIRVDYGPLKAAIHLEMTQNYFSPKELSDNGDLQKIVRDAIQKDQRHEKNTDLEKKALNVQNQRGLLDAIVSGAGMSLFPNPSDINGPWYTFGNLSDRSLPYAADASNRAMTLVRGMIEAYGKSDAHEWNVNSTDFVEFLRHDITPSTYPTVSTLEREVNYNHLRPFRWAWVFYTLAFISLVSAIVTNHKLLKWGGGIFLAAAFLMHAYGFALRCLIAGRPPVSNMYESVIWVTWGCVFFSILIWLKYKKIGIPTAATVFAVTGLVLADNLPAVLDPSIQPLEPVLRSNYWLTIHVLTITLSYAAFALSLCIGNIVLGAYLFKPTQVHTIQHFTLYMYRAMQIGVILLAAGTILGGVWADYSWGRFWGWDPKEVWALIALLLYIAVLHGRFTGWLTGFGFVATTVMSFLGVLMAWYGVNFVLGVGLHSYGFGTGGMVYVLSYVAAQLVFIGLAYRSHLGAKASGHHMEPSIFPRAH